MSRLRNTTAYLVAVFLLAGASSVKSQDKKGPVATLATVTQAQIAKAVEAFFDNNQFRADFETEIKDLNVKVQYKSPRIELMSEGAKRSLRWSIEKGASSEALKAAMQKVLSQSLAQNLFMTTGQPLLSNNDMKALQKDLEVKLYVPPPKPLIVVWLDGPSKKLEAGAVKTVRFRVTGVDPPTSKPVLSAISSEPEVLVNKSPELAADGSGALELTTTATAAGRSATLTLSVKNGEQSGSATLSVVVAQPITGLTVSWLDARPDLTLEPGKSMTVHYRVTGMQTPGIPVMNATSNLSGVTVKVDGPDTLTLTSDASASGTARISLKAVHGQQTGSASLVVTLKSGSEQGDGTNTTIVNNYYITNKYYIIDYYFAPHGGHPGSLLGNPGCGAPNSYFEWYIPRYANYTHSHGHYLNWWHDNGYAFYTGQQMHPPMHPGMHPQGGGQNLRIIVVEKDGKRPILPPPKKEMKEPKEPGKKEPGKVSIHLPADAKLTFNGVLAGGKGETRTFVTPDLNPDQDYEYVLTAEVVRDGETKSVTERAIIRAGETTTVTLTPTAAAGR